VPAGKVDGTVSSATLREDAVTAAAAADIRRRPRTAT